jgi:hypothetical protein
MSMVRVNNNAWRTRIGAGQRIGMAKNVLATDLVVEQIEAESGLRLRLTIELSLKVPELFGRFQAFGQSPLLTIFKNAPEVRALSSAGITRPQWSYDPVRLPPDPPPKAMLKPRPPIRTGLPRLPASPSQRAVSITPADRTGAYVDCFPARAAFPKLGLGRRPHCFFRGLLRLHTTLRPAGSLNRPMAAFVTRLRSGQLPNQIARQLPDQSTTLWVEPSSTDDTRLRGAP